MLADCITHSLLSTLSRLLFFFSSPQLLLLVTLSTASADVGAALKYLRFARKIDWNNFSHTDSFGSAFLRIYDDDYGVTFDDEFS